MMMTRPAATFIAFLCFLILSKDQVSAETGYDDAEECVVGDDGTCISRSDDECVDMNEDCDRWAQSGECDNNAGYMLRACKKACDLCDLTDDQFNAILAKKRELWEAEERRKEEERQQYGIKQIIHSAKGQQTLESMNKYMSESVMNDDRFTDEIRDFCLNKDKGCVEWSAAGECDANKNYMTTNCAPACQTCHLLIFEERCPWTPSNDTNIWKAGDLDKMFERIVTSPEYATKYQIEILSRPPEGPWVVTLDNFLSDAETDRLIELGGKRGYDKSKDVGEEQPDGTYSDYDSPDRTSTNTWCLADCYRDEMTQSVLAKMEDLTGIPDAYSEYLQLLNYEVGQFYKQHHDYIWHLRNRAEGARVATLFLYLNDVEAGGGTNFPLLNNMTVMPKKGKALLWPSVLNEDPNAKDDRTDHQALPVEAGVKYGANAWLHNRDFKEPYERGCA